MKFLGVLLMLLCPPIGWGLLGYLMYRQTSENAKKSDERPEELAAIHDELAHIREHLADIVLELEDARRSAIPSDADRTR